MNLWNNHFSPYQVDQRNSKQKSGKMEADCNPALKNQTVILFYNGQPYVKICKYFSKVNLIGFQTFIAIGCCKYNSNFMPA